MCVCVCVCVYLCACMFLFMHVCLCMYACIYVVALHTQGTGICTKQFNHLSTNYTKNWWHQCFLCLKNLTNLTSFWTHNPSFLSNRRFLRLYTAGTSGTFVDMQFDHTVPQISAQTIKDCKRASQKTSYWTCRFRPFRYTGASEVGEAFAATSKDDGKGTKKYVFRVPIISQFGGSTVQEVFGGEVSLFVCVSIFVCVCMYAHVYIYICVCVCVYGTIYTYICGVLVTL